MANKICAIVGSYRKNGSIDSAVDVILTAARENGAQTSKLYLVDHKIEYCSNCRECTQQPGPQRGKCVKDDDMESILQGIEAADCVIFGAPVNYFNVTAVFRCFLERLLPYAYWPWGQKGPSLRNTKLTKKAVLVTSSAMPGFLIPLATGAPRALRLAAQSVGAKPVATILLGLSAQQQKQSLPEAVTRRARNIGTQLA